MYFSHPLTPINKTFRLSAPNSCSRVLSLSYNMSNFCVAQTLMEIIYTSYRIKCFPLCIRSILLLKTIREKSINLKLKRTNTALIISNINILWFCSIKTIVDLISISIMNSAALAYFEFLTCWIKESWINFSLITRFNTSFGFKKWLIYWLSYFIFFITLLVFQIIIQLWCYSIPVISILKLN